MQEVSPSGVKFAQVECFGDFCDLKKLKLGEKNEDPSQIVGILLLYASWNLRLKPTARGKTTSVLSQLAAKLAQGLELCQVFVGSLQIDGCEESLSLFIGDNGLRETNLKYKLPLPPSELPNLALVFQTSSMNQSILRYIPGIRPSGLVDLLLSQSKSVDIRHQHVLLESARGIMQQLESDYNLSVSCSSCNSALRIFVAGDRSSVGKSSVCLGILGNLLGLGYAPEHLAYIKPATQSESTQLIQLYCERHGIECRPIGPLVYYRGFTRAFLAGETLSSEELLEQCGRAVDRLARNKRVVLIDGVGFPAVGSICETDNARVARACSYPVIPTENQNINSNTISQRHYSRKSMGVVLVGGSGVGAAVDAFNLNASYFEKYQVPVLGAVFNKLEQSGFYSLENCRQEVGNYFEQSQEQLQRKRRPFGFVPLYPSIAGDKGMEHVDDFLRVFGEHVDVSAILEAAQRVKDDVSESTFATSIDDGMTRPMPPIKRRKLEHVTDTVPLRSRAAIEQAAIVGGAAPSA